MKVIIYDTLDKYLIRDWKTLWKKSSFANFTNSPEWFAVAQKTYDYKNKRIVALYNDKMQLVGVCGLVREKIAGLSVWTGAVREFSGNESILIDYTNYLHVKLFVSELSKLGSIYLTNYKINTLQNIVRCKNTTTLCADVNLFVDFNQGSYGNLSPKKIRNIEHKLNKYGVIWRGEANVMDKKYALEQALIIESHSSKLAKGKSAFDNKLNRNFYENLVHMTPENIVLSLVWFNEEPIAYSICFLNKGVLQGSQKAHLTQFNQFSPGKLLVASISDYIRSQNQPYLDFGRGVDDFKKSFATRSEDLYSLFISENKYFLFYLKNVYALRMYAYNKISKFRKLYKLYKLVKGVKHG